MSSRESSKAESVKKRARESDALAYIDVNKRTKDLSKKLFSLHNEFPEVKYIARSKKFLKHAVKMNRDTMIENVEEKEIHEEEESAPLYSLPDELVTNCLSFLGEGLYGSVGLVSKKLNQAYKADFGQETTYNEMATSVKLVNYCIKEFGKTHQDDLFKAAAVNGNLDVLRALVKVGYNLSLLIRMEKKTLYGTCDDNWITSDDFEPYITECCFSKKEDIYYTDDEGVDLSQIVARGHLHVLKYLREELDCHEGLEKYVQPAIQYGKVEILEWLRDIGCMNSGHKMFTFYHDPYEQTFWRYSFCDEAVRCGNVQSLGWLLDHEYEFDEYFPVLLNAVRSKSTKMIRFCFEKYDSDFDDCKHAIIESQDIEVYHLFHELGFEFKGDIVDWVGHYGTHDIANNFYILKFLRSISVPWNNKIMAVIVEHGTLEMIQYAHEDGCPWTSHGDEYDPLLRGLNQSKIGKMVKVEYVEKWKYLINNGCTFNYGHLNLWTITIHLKEFLTSKKDLVLLRFFVCKNPSFDDELFRYFLIKASGGELWFEGISHMLENGENSSNIFRSIKEVSQRFFINNHVETYGWTQQTLFDLMRSKKDVALLEHFVGKNSRFDNELFRYFIDKRFGELWFEGICYLLKNGKDD